MTTPPPVQTLFDLGLGPWIIPLRGKIPQYGAWPDLPCVDPNTVCDWIDAGYNLGFRTGAASGLVVIDDDRARYGEQPDDLPPTGLVCESPTGGRHYYYRAPDPCPGNSASKLAPHVDVRGTGGQVVVPPSHHPVARRPYRWIETGEPGTLPESVLERLRSPEPEPAATPASESSPAYARSALLREVHRVRTATEGTRNETLNRAAFNLGQLVGGGELGYDQVHAELSAAAALAGLGEREVQATLRSGLGAGTMKPRTAPERPATATQPAPAPAPTSSLDVLVPGSHTLPGGEYREQGAHGFAADVIRLLPGGTLYRRADTVGEIIGGEFRPASPHRLRSIIDRRLRLCVGKEPKSGEDEPYIAYRSCSKDHAEIVRAYAECSPGIRDLRHLATHPVCVGSDFTTAQPGWNATSGVFLASSAPPEPLDLPTARAVLEDLVCDFPFEHDADLANYLGLMLTPILRPALGEPVPMHLITSPVERSGKTKLAEIVLGCTVLGRPTPAMQLGEREDDRSKRIMSALLAGRTVMHLDNLTAFLDSPTLASLLTSTVYEDRILGLSKLAACENSLTVVGTGNNVHATGEVAKRIVPIRLLPRHEAPEARDDFRHPQLREYAEAQRERVLGALLGLIAHWRDEGRPLGPSSFGGFERWAAVVGGVLGAAGYEAWLGNLSTWRGTADEFSLEVASLVRAWQERWLSEWVPGSDLYELAQELGLFGWVDRAKSDRGKRTAFGLKVLNRVAGRVVEGGLRVEVDGVGQSRRARLRRV